VEFEALPAAVRGHLLTRLARATLRNRPPPPPRRAPAAPAADELWVVETADLAREAAADRLVYDATAGQFLGPGGLAAPPAHVGLVRFLTHPDLVPADAVALHRRGVRWTRAAGVWDAQAAAGLGPASIGLGFVDEVWAPIAQGDLPRPVRTAIPAAA
jgi:hypothetical protein